MTTDLTQAGQQLLPALIQDLLNEAAFRCPNGIADPADISHDDRVAAQVLREYADRLLRKYRAVVRRDTDNYSLGLGDPAEPRELVGRFVRQVWVAWASEQPSPKPSWLLPWEELDDGQREVDMRIGTALFEAGTRSVVHTKQDQQHG